MAMLLLTHDGLTLKRIPLDQPELRIGRKTDSDLFIDDRLASQNHATVEMHANADAGGARSFFIRDLNSTNHTYVNGSPVELKQLVHNDVIVIGKHTFKFIDDDVDADDKTAKLKKSWIPGVYYTQE